MAEAMKQVEMPDFNPELSRTVVEGVLAEAGGRPVEPLAEEENQGLLGLLRLRNQ